MIRLKRVVIKFMNDCAPTSAECLAQLHDLKLCFPGFENDQLEVMLPYLQCRQFIAGEIVLTQGDPGDFMGFVVKGKMVVKKETLFPGKHILLAILEDGSMFGEISLASAHTRSATVVAVEDSATLILTHENADTLFKEHPALALKLMKNILAVVGLRLQKSGSRLAELL